jgi:hypothetical protein
MMHWDRITTATRPGSLLSCLASLIVIASVSACSGNERTASESRGEVAPGTERTFASPEAAGAALLAAAKSGDVNSLMAIFGPDSRTIVSSGDSVEDRNMRQSFVDRYTRMNRWRQDKAGNEILVIGPTNWLFPIPLTRNASGQWAFNTAAGKDEVLARRIGSGELTAMGVLSEMANAQQAYYSQFHQFAEHFVSDSGQRNGLYWSVPAGQQPSPLGSLANVADSLGYARTHRAQPQPFVGYFYKMLTAQGDAAKGGAKDYVADGKMTGGFAVLAWPVRYKESGIMTFMVARDGVIYQRDLGQRTSDSAAAITAFNPTSGWTVVLAPEPASTPGPQNPSRKQALQNAKVRPSTGL